MTVWQKYYNKRRYLQTFLINYVESEGTVLCANSQYQKFTDKEISSRTHCSFLGPIFFFVIISSLTQKLTHKPWPITTIIPLSPGVGSKGSSMAMAATKTSRRQRCHGNAGDCTVAAARQQGGGGGDSVAAVVAGYCRSGGDVATAQGQWRWHGCGVSAVAVARLWR